MGMKAKTKKNILYAVLIALLIGCVYLTYQLHMNKMKKQDITSFYGNINEMGKYMK